MPDMLALTHKLLLVSIARPPTLLVAQVRHFYRDTRMNMTHNFGDPFLLMLGANETLASVRARIQVAPVILITTRRACVAFSIHCPLLDVVLQAKLSLSDEEFAKWKLALVSFGRVEYLEDEEEVVKARFRKHDNYGNWDDYLGLEHQQVNSPE